MTGMEVGGVSLGLHRETRMMEVLVRTVNGMTTHGCDRELPLQKETGMMDNYSWNDA